MYVKIHVRVGDINSVPCRRYLAEAISIVIIIHFFLLNGPVSVTDVHTPPHPYLINTQIYMKDVRPQNQFLFFELWSIVFTIYKCVT